jgi:hypothetical protein
MILPCLSRDQNVLKRAQASFVIATIMPISTNTTIAICIQIQVGDMARDSVAGRVGRVLAPVWAPVTIV